MLSDRKRQVTDIWNCCMWLVNLFEKIIAVGGTLRFGSAASGCF
jgi:hypothetical protein